MNIRQAILKAADSIEKHPDLFNFGSINNPNHECGTPGCALGWIAVSAGIDKKWSACWKVERLLKISNSAEFYDKMDAVKTGNWMCSATSCADTLRAYADKYHPEKHTGLPEDIKQILTGEREVELKETA